MKKEVLVSKAARARASRRQKLRSFLTRTRSFQRSRLYFKPGGGQNIALHAFLADSSWTRLESRASRVTELGGMITTMLPWLFDLKVNPRVIPTSPFIFLFFPRIRVMESVMARGTVGSGPSDTGLLLIFVCVRLFVLLT